jgi:hypothetical protein
MDEVRLGMIWDGEDRMLRLARNVAVVGSTAVPLAGSLVAWQWSRWGPVESSGLVEKFCGVKM